MDEKYKKSLGHFRQILESFDFLSFFSQLDSCWKMQLVIELGIEHADHSVIATFLIYSNFTHKGQLRQEYVLDLGTFTSPTA